MSVSDAEGNQYTSETPPKMPMGFTLAEVHNGWLIDPRGQGGAFVVEKLRGRDNMAVLLGQIACILGDPDAIALAKKREEANAPAVPSPGVS